ncbi:glycine cleavage system protein GcvH [Leucothrix mucor]|jgi:glycine cleavage system H protein|uniref:glycine cleavage system protein GcvH n=1 Tax=Leucothrix mucor TaxID=45248 RepID=UPI0003B5B5DA|nr:glycine cleavage system protein GcvH [Leucothrix mucor]
MSNLPTDLKYAASHEWVKSNDDGTVTVGITDHAQELLGDLVFVELPEEGAELTAGEQCAVVESVKAASDVYAPVSGEVVAINGDLDGEPELVNTAPFEGGWMFRVKLSSPEQLDDLMDADAYLASLDA